MFLQNVRAFFLSLKSLKAMIKPAIQSMTFRTLTPRKDTSLDLKIEYYNH